MSCCRWCSVEGGCFSELTCVGVLSGVTCLTCRAHVYYSVLLGSNARKPFLLVPPSCASLQGRTPPADAFPAATRLWLRLSLRSVPPAGAPSAATMLAQHGCVQCHPKWLQVEMQKQRSELWGKQRSIPYPGERPLVQGHSATRPATSVMVMFKSCNNRLITKGVSNKNAAPA